MNRTENKAAGGSPTRGGKGIRREKREGARGPKSFPKYDRTIQRSPKCSFFFLELNWMKSPGYQRIEVRGRKYGN